MKLSIITVGNKMPPWVDTAYNEYDQRLPKELKPRLIELALAPRSKANSVENIKERESKQILSAISQASRAIMLDVKGKSFSTEKLALKLQDWQMSGTDISLVIGGPDGLANSCLQKADELWSLSALTLPHPLVRVVLIEQLYRAWTITQNHPYHK